MDIKPGLGEMPRVHDSTKNVIKPTPVLEPGSSSTPVMIGYSSGKLTMGDDDYAYSETRNDDGSITLSMQSLDGSFPAETFTILKSDDPTSEPRIQTSSGEIFSIIASSTVAPDKKSDVSLSHDLASIQIQATRVTTEGTPNSVTFSHDGRETKVRVKRNIEEDTIKKPEDSPAWSVGLAAAMFGIFIVGTLIYVSYHLRKSCYRTPSTIPVP